MKITCFLKHKDTLVIIVVFGLPQLGSPMLLIEIKKNELQTGSKWLSSEGMYGNIMKLQQIELINFN